MTRDDVIRFGEQADEVADRKIRMRGEFHPEWHEVRDEAFAALVAAAAKEEEREAILGVVKAMHDRESRGPEHPVRRWQDAFGWNMTRKDAVSDVLHHIRARSDK